MERLAVYNVDKVHQFEKPVVINITTGFDAYLENEAMEIGLYSTKPFFLGMFRRVLYDGSISKMSECRVIHVPVNSSVVIDVDSMVYISIDNLLDAVEKSLDDHVGNYRLKKCTFSLSELLDDEFESCYSMTQDGFNKYLDSFKTKTKSKSKKSKVRGYNPDMIIVDEYEDIRPLLGDETNG